MKDYKITMTLEATETSQNAPETVGEALELMKDSGNYPSPSTMRRDIDRQNLPEMTYSFNWGGWRFNLIVERVKI